MDLITFQKNAKRTCPDLGSLILNLIHMVLGLRTEIAEWKLQHDYINAIEEIGDFAWYNANAQKFLGFDFILLDQMPIEVFQLFKDNALLTNEAKIEFLVDELLDMCKKNLAYKKPFSFTTFSNYLSICHLLWHKELQRLNKISSKVIVMEELLKRNIEKLKIRFPDKFDETLAINRNVVEERKVLEDQ